MYYFVIYLLFISTFAWAQDQQIIETIMVVEDLSLINELVSEEEIQAKKCDEENERKQERKAFYSLEVDPMFSFSVNQYLGNFQKSEKKFIDNYQSGFHSKWLDLIKPKSQQDRESVMRDICQNFSQEDAIAFAAYIGSKNSDIYDYDRVSGSGNPQEDEHLSLDALYATHRNVAGIETQGGNLHDRTKMGVCGDSAMMVANFLSHCGFKCEDIDISSYSVDEAGHTMVSARGKNGEYFTANWNEASSHTNTNPLTLKTPDPRNVNTGSVMRLHDCHGKAKGKTMNPLGNLLMLAHGNDRILNSGQNFTQIELMARELGADEVVISAFRGIDNESGQTLEGISTKFHHQMGTDQEFLQINLEGSLVFGKAKREIERYEGETPLLLEQDVLSSWGIATIQGNLNRKGNVLVSPFVAVESYLMGNKFSYTDENGNEETGKTGDAYLKLYTGVKVKTSSSKKVILDSEFGVGATDMKDSPQRGGVDTGTAAPIIEKNLIRPDLIYGKANIFIMGDKGNSSSLQVQYDNLFLMKSSRMKADFYKKFAGTELGVGYNYLKFPSASGNHGASLEVSQAIALKKSQLVLKGRATYYFIQRDPIDNTFANVSIIYRLGK